MANRIKYKTRRYFGFMHPIMTWEYHCFAYRKGGHDSQTVYDGSEIEFSDAGYNRVMATTTHKTHVERFVHFRRHEEYPKNPIFVLLELLMSIVSRVRVFLGKFLIAGIFILTLMESMEIATLYLIPALSTIYVLSFIVPLAGFIVRNAFGLDKKMDDVCDENGWMRWSEYKDQ